MGIEVPRATSAISSGLSGAAWAQSYPAKPLRIIVGFAPGGAPDTMTRLFADRLPAALQLHLYPWDSAPSGRDDPLCSRIVHVGANVERDELCSLVRKGPRKGAVPKKKTE